MCERQFTEKYTKRASPPYPANQCCYRSFFGNDGAIYKSTPGVNGVCTWKSHNTANLIYNLKPYRKSPRKSPRRSRKKSRKSRK